MRRTLKICRNAWTRFGNYPGSPSPVLPQSDDCGENWDCRFFTLQGSAVSVCSCEAGRIAFVKRTRSQPRLRGCSRGLGYDPNKQKLSPHNLFQQCSVAIRHIVNYPIAGNGFEVFSCAVNFGLLNQPQLHGTHRAFCFRYKVNMFDTSLIESDSPIWVMMNRTGERIGSRSNSNSLFLIISS